MTAGSGYEGVSIMGVLRLYLALCVVAAHSTDVFPWSMHIGAQAVQIFFIISGFYMQMVYSKYATAREFYASRLIRIMLPYWVILLAVLALSLVWGLLSSWWGVLEPYREVYPETGSLGIMLTAVTNFTVFGQDWVMFFKHEHGESLQFTAAFWRSPGQLFPYLMIPQAWSVGVELTFYLCVPILATLSGRRLAGVIVGSLLLRVLFFETTDLTDDPWNYRFFPFEVYTFGLGMAAYRLGQRDEAQLARLAKWFPTRGVVGVVFYAGSVLLLCWLMEWLYTIVRRGLDYHYATLVTYVIWAILIALVFRLGKGLRWDRAVGELSYPVYLWHYFLVGCFRQTDLARAASGDWFWLGPAVAVTSVLLSVLTVLCLIAPLDRVRYRWAKRFGGGGDREA
ncbi:MAG: acyltransferase [Planctomycetota bacterium]